MTRSYIEQQLLNNKLVVYPCLKPFNVPGPSHPNTANGERTYHDIDTPLINIGSIIERKLLVYADDFQSLLDIDDGDDINILFFTDKNSKSIPTIVSWGVLNGEG